MDERRNELERVESPEPYPMFLGQLWASAFAGREAAVLDVPERLVRLVEAAGDRAGVDRALVAALRGELDLWIACGDSWTIEPDCRARPDQPIGRIATMDVAPLLRDGRVKVEHLELRLGWIRLEEGLELSSDSVFVDESAVEAVASDPAESAAPSPAPKTEASRSSRVLRVPDVCDLTGLSRTTVWRLEKRGDFPARRRLGPQAVGWTEEEVLAWIDDRQMAGPRRCRGGPSDADSGRSE
jgi:predicted DNA-binding transcriptional regulator AlpA